MSRPSPSRDRIIRFILGSSLADVPSPGKTPHPYRRPFTTLYEFASRTGIAFSWVHGTFDLLRQHGWIDLRHGLSVRDAPAIFDWWLQHSSAPRYHSLHVANAWDASKRLLKEFGIQNAFTTYYAENACQGHLYPRRADVYVRQADLSEARRHLVHDLDAQLGGTNFRLVYGDDHVLDEKLTMPTAAGRRDLAPLPQVILDLMREGGSAREAADLLIQRAFPHA